MIKGSTYSLVVENYRYTWETKTLIKASKNYETMLWLIPEEFLAEWSWGEDSPADHIERCLNADLSFPILVWDSKILDGCHRIIKALATGENKIKAIIIRDIPAPDSITDFNEDIVESNFKFRDVVELVKIKLNQ